MFLLPRENKSLAPRWEEGIAHKEQCFSNTSTSEPSSNLMEIQFSESETLWVGPPIQDFTVRGTSWLCARSWEPMAWRRRNHAPYLAAPVPPRFGSTWCCQFWAFSNSSEPNWTGSYMDFLHILFAFLPTDLLFICPIFQLPKFCCCCLLSCSSVLCICVLNRNLFTEILLVFWANGIKKFCLVWAFLT